MGNQTVEHYLSLGMEQKVAEYFAAGRKKLIGATANSDFTLSLFYENQPERIYDMKPIIKSSNVFSFLQEEEHFSRVYVDDFHSVCWDKDPTIDSDVVWNNKVDLCPDTMFVNSVSKQDTLGI